MKRSVRGGTVRARAAGIEALSDRGGRARARDAVWHLIGLELLATVDEARIRALADRVVVREQPARRSVPLDPGGDRVYLVASGGLKLVRLTVEGRRIVDALLARGDLFGRISAGAGAGEDRGGDRDADGDQGEGAGGEVEGEDEAYEVEALEDVTLLVLRRADVQALMRAEPEVSLRVVQMLEDRQRTLSRRIASLVFKDVRSRTIETLIALIEDHGGPCEHGFPVDVRLNQQDLADLVGASRESVNRVLGELARRLVIVRQGRHICVPDPGRLQRATAR